MVITVASHKGGVGKTTTAMNLADYLQQSRPTLLLDSDPTRNALHWAERKREGKSLGFAVAPFGMFAKLAGQYADDRGHIVIDTGQRLFGDDLKEAAYACDLLVLPAVPKPLDNDGLVQIIQALQTIGAGNYRVLLTQVSQHLRREADDLRRELTAIGVPMFAAEIPALKVFSTAAGEGELVRNSKQHNAQRAWAAYEAAGRELTA